MFDEKDLLVGWGFMSFSIMMLIGLAFLRPFDDEVIGLFSGLINLIGLILAFIFVGLSIKLYGRGSSEGKIWFRIFIALIFILIGAVAGIFGNSFPMLAVFIGIGFVIFILSNIDKMRSAGVKPNTVDIVYASFVVVLIMIIISAFMMMWDGAPEGYEPGKNFYLYITVICLSFALAFTCTLMARLMGGHISEGWYFLAMGAVIFSVSFNFQAVLQEYDAYTPGHFLEAFNLMAINAITFSAYYQRRKHLALIEGI